MDQVVNQRQLMMHIGIVHHTQQHVNRQHGLFRETPQALCKLLHKGGRTGMQHHADARPPQLRRPGPARDIPQLARGFPYPACHLGAHPFLAVQRTVDRPARNAARVRDLLERYRHPSTIPSRSLSQCRL